MDVWQAIVLGVVQGLTEFLPVSSSGHLVLAQEILGLTLENTLAFDVLLHFGTLLAVLVYFRKDLIDMALACLGRDVPAAETLRHWVLLLGLATLPVVVVGGLFADAVESAFHSVPLVGAALLVTGTLLLTAARKPAGGREADDFLVRDALVVGLFQCMALVPGISRAGSTIVGGLLCGLDREAAARFAFLMSIPAILGALVKNASGLQALAGEASGPLVAGTVAAALTGWLAIEIMMRVVRNGRLRGFAVYCFIVGISALVVSVGFGG